MIWPSTIAQHSRTPLTPNANKTYELAYDIRINTRAYNTTQHSNRLTVHLHE